jgi:hypothetical protein
VKAIIRLRTWFQNWRPVWSYVQFYAPLPSGITNNLSVRNVVFYLPEVRFFSHSTIAFHQLNELFLRTVGYKGHRCYTQRMHERRLSWSFMNTLGCDWTTWVRFPAEIFLFVASPGPLWSPLSLLSSVYCGPFFRRQSDWSVKMITEAYPTVRLYLQAYI